MAAFKSNFEDLWQPDHASTQDVRAKDGYKDIFKSRRFRKGLDDDMQGIEEETHEEGATKGKGKGQGKNTWIPTKILASEMQNICTTLGTGTSRTLVGSFG